MNYEVKILGKAYTLPARTLDVDDQIERVSDIDRAYSAGEINRREAVERMYSFVASLAPGAFTEIESTDTNDILKACLDIISAYSAPAIKARAEAKIQEAKDILNRPEIQKVLTLMNAKK
jgi:hypothetical protein